MTATEQQRAQASYPISSQISWNQMKSSSAEAYQRDEGLLFSEN